MKKHFFVKLAALALAIGITIPIPYPYNPCIYTTYAAEPAEDLPDNTKDGIILQAHMWSFNNIKNHIPEIAAAGYKSVQVSPVQNSKSGSDWWYLYQPLNQSIGNRLGSKEEFESLCSEAEKYDVAILVDAVMNHMANKSDNQKDEWSDQLDPAFKRSDFYHNKGQCSNWKSRHDVTQLGIGMPDLNTQDNEVQQKAITFLNECIDAGADGFRFDAAKHIETNIGEDANQPWACNYWDNVLGNLHNKNQLFLYGETLDEPDSNSDNLQAYTNYMSVTDHYYGRTLRDAVRSNQLRAAQNWDIDLSYGQRVSYVENHDNFEHNQSNITDFQRKICWGILASRDNVTPLYLSRRFGQVGSEGSSDWKDQEVSAVNHFHNAMVGQSEYLRYPNDNCIMIDRGTIGTSIINAGGNFYINQTTKLEEGSYTDKGGSGSTFNVTNGIITGNVPSGRIMVLYHDGVADECVKVSPEKPVIGEKVTITYNASDRPLNGASQISIHWGYDGWISSGIQTTPMFSIGGNKWEVVLTVPSDAKNTMEFVFTDGNGKWDNNDGKDWSAALSSGAES